MKLERFSKTANDKPLEIVSLADASMWILKYINISVMENEK